MARQSKKRLFFDYIGISVGCFITAVGLNIFLIPNKIPDGGFSGLSMILHYLLNVPVGMTLLVLNIPILLIAFKIFGLRFSINTIFGAVALASSIDISVKFLPVITQNLLLASLYGGVLSGLGMGIVFRFRGTTAGTATAAAILNKLFGIKVGSALMMVDFVVIILAAIAFNNMELCLYGLIVVFTSSYIVDLVQEGPANAKAFLIITEKSEAVAKHVMKELDHGLTFLQGRGGFTGDKKELLLCVVTTSEVTRLRDAITDIDKNAFVIVADTREVMGKGFSAQKVWKK